MIVNLWHKYTTEYFYLYTIVYIKAAESFSKKTPLQNEILTSLLKWLITSDFWGIVSDYFMRRPILGGEGGGGNSER